MMRNLFIITVLVSLIVSCGDDKKSKEFSDNIKTTSPNTDEKDLFEKEAPQNLLFNPTKSLSTDEDTLSYCLGYLTASRLEMMTPNPNHFAFSQAIKDFQKGNYQIDDKSAMKLVEGYFKQGVSSADQSKSSGSRALLNKKDSCCYAYGIIASDGITKHYKWANLDLFLAGYDENLDTASKVNDEGVQAVQMRVGNRKNQQQMAEQKRLDAIKHKDMIQPGADFLAKNKKREEVTELPSGLQYEVLKKGSGPKPQPTERVKVHYHGALIDGSVFDSSVDRGQPATFGVTQVIRGWVEALQLMPVGSKWKLYIPYDLAYGAQGSPPKIAPFSALIFEVELLSIEN